jgi:hypothetical protein
MKAHETQVIDWLRGVLDLGNRTQRNPFGVVAVAAGVGFVLGGGLSSRLTDRVAGTALRLGLLALWPRLEEELGWFSEPVRKSAGSSKQKGEST